MRHIEADDTSLPSNIQLIDLTKSQMRPVKIVIQEKSENEESEVYSEEFESEFDVDVTGSEIETPVVEIELGIPRYVSFEEFDRTEIIPMFENTPRSETKRLGFDKPKTIDVFNKKSKLQASIRTPLEKSHNAFGRLEDARKHAKEQKFLDFSVEMENIFEDLNPKSKLELNTNFYDEMIDGEDFDSSYDSRPAPTFDYRNQKNVSMIQDSGMLDIGKLISEQPVFGFQNDTKPQVYEGSSLGVRSGTGQRSQSRRYEEDYDQL